MGQVYKSGAFIQQCFAVHPLCLTLKKLDLPARLIFHCSSCNLIHAVAVRTLSLRVSVMRAVEEGPGRSASERLTDCAGAHLTAIGVRAMDVVRDQMGLRCADCRRLFDLEIGAIETH
ncbi:MAG: hypothetical protein ACKOBZ_00080 [Nitrospira sp.]